ncbi:hypothetical protein LUZ63_003818 [Rhynchospora breviuscula]|uniref:E2 ubiquitin-conjugating enzyme n=1 Tax=Rhynchospora breviuscula TaxID=2022672 RepID=A0A9Q0HZ28_9POAL|nr:hypothetical protein LUZ63_003818 [Rhynchospora breviuscula]
MARDAHRLFKPGLITRSDIRKSAATIRYCYLPSYSPLPFSEQLPFPIPAQKQRTFVPFIPTKPISSTSFFFFSDPYATSYFISLFSSQAMLDVSRLQKELVECNRDKQISGVSISLPDGSHDLTHLIGSITGPVSSPYEGGTFTIDIRLPNGYPFEPPKMQFVTKVWHPNISSQNGAICLDILKDQWSPALTLKTALLSLQALLSSPEPDDPQDAVVAQQYLRDYPKFVATASHWTAAFAKMSVGIEEKVKRLVEMGFPEDLVRNTLKSVNGDENLALEKLCSG